MADSSSQGGGPRRRPSRANIICVIGGPGAGKGTQCTRLAANLPVKHLSVGDLLRAEAEKPANGQLLDIKAQMADGKLLPVEYVQKILERHIKNNQADGYERFLVDGFPRSVEQARLFKESGYHVITIFNFCCSEEIMLERVLKRGETSGRVDDKVDTFKKRFQGFQEEAAAIVEYYGDRAVDIPCDKPLEEIYPRLESMTKDIFDLNILGVRKAGQEWKFESSAV